MLRRKNLVITGLLIVILFTVGCSQHETKSTVKSPLKTSIIGKGKIKKKPEKELYKEGTKVKLTAKGQKKDNWQFVRWTGSGGTENKKIIVMERNLVVGAKFVDAPEFDLQVKSTAEEVSKRTIKGRITEKNGTVKGVEIDWGDKGVTEVKDNFTDIVEVHDYSSGGKYTITVEAKNKKENTGKFTKQVEIQIPKINVNKTIEGNNVVLAGEIIGNVEKVKIGWGDNSSVLKITEDFSNINASHEYDNTKNYYLITISVITSDSAQTIKTIKVDDLTSNQLPEINLQLAEVNPETNVVKLTGEVTDDKKLKKTTIDWGDDKQQTKIENGFDNIEETHTYDEDKEYTIQITAIDNKEQEQNEEINVTELEAGNIAPEINVTKRIQESKVILEGSIIDKDHQLDTSFIYWGDGSRTPITSEGELKVSHDYELEKDYTIKVEAVDSQSKENSKTMNIEIPNPVPQINISPNADNYNVELTGNVTDDEQIKEVKIKWEAGNSKTLEQGFSNISERYKYNSEGQKQIEIIALDNEGGKRTTTITPTLNYCPTAPELTAPTNGQEFYINSQSKDVTFSWSASEDKDANDNLKYDVYVWRENQEPQKRKTVSSTQCTIEGLDYGYTYNWKVKVRDGDGGNNESGERSFEVIKNLPPDISNLSAIIDNHTVKLKGDIKDDNGIKQIEIKWEEGSIETFTTNFTDLPAKKKEYTYDSGGEKQIKVTVTDNKEVEKAKVITPILNYQPSAPSLIAPLDGTIRVEKNLILDWEASKDKNGDDLKYDVYLWAKNDEKQKVAADLTGTNYQISKLECDITYKWQVVVKDERGATTKSNIYNFKIISGLTTLKGEIYQRGTYPTSYFVLETNNEKTYRIKSTGELFDKLMNLKGLMLILKGDVTENELNFGFLSSDGTIDVKYYNVYYTKDMNEVSVLGIIKQKNNQLILRTKKDRQIIIDPTTYNSSFKEKVGKEIVISGSLISSDKYYGLMKMKGYRIIETE